MSNVGVFPGWQSLNRQTTRAPVNPFDKSTIFSIFPFDVEDKKPTLSPGHWKIPAGSLENPSRLSVEPSSWWREIDPEQPLLEIPVSSILIADSIVRDYCAPLLGCDITSMMPGLFYIPGDISIDTLKKSHMNLLANAEQKQRKWYQELVKIGDIAWARTQGNPLSVNEMMKRAASELGLQDRDWLKAYHSVNMIKCFACGSLRNPEYPVCPSCKAVDPNYKSDIKFAT